MASKNTLAIQGKFVDISAIADGFGLVYNGISGQFEMVDIATELENTLQQAYDNGPDIATTGGKPIAFENTVDTSDLLELSRTFAGAGSALSVSMGAATTGTAIAVTSTGSGNLLSLSNGTTVLQVSPTQVLAADGVNTAPGYSFGSDTDAGMYVSGSALEFSFAGITRLTMAGAGVRTVGAPLQTPSGSVGGPTHSFSTDTNTGMYSPGADLVGITGGGTEVARFSAPTGINPQILSAAGTSSLPMYSFAGDPDAGMYSIGGTTLGFAVNGTERLRVSTAVVRSTEPFEGPTASASDPTFSFTGDSNTGVYNVAGDQLGVAASGIEIARFQAAAGINPQVLLQGGSASLPALGFVGDPNTGVYNFAADGVGIVAGGVDVGVFSAPGGTLPQLVMQDGAAGNPAFSFGLDADTGMYSLGADNLGFATGGTNRMDISNARVRFAEPAESNQVGSAGTPSFGFTGAAGSGLGMYAQTATTRLALSANSVEMLRLDGAAVSPQLLAVSGSAANAGYGFLSDVDTGMYLVAAGALGLTAGGTVRLTVDTTQILSIEPFVGPLGASTTPTFTFTGDTNTGMFSAGADLLSFSAGAERYRINASYQMMATNFGSATLPNFSWSGDADSGIFNPVDGSVGMAGNTREIGRFVSPSATTSYLKMLNGNIASTTSAVSNALYAKSVPKLWAKINSGSGTPTILNGFNITSVTVTGSNLLITIGTNMSSAEYAVATAAMFSANATYVTSAESTTQFTIIGFDADTGTNLSLATTTSHFGVVVFGQQT